MRCLCRPLTKVAWRPQGERVWPDGSRYVGEWYAGERNGEGTFEYADGSKYIGTVPIITSW